MSKAKKPFLMIDEDFLEDSKIMDLTESFGAGGIGIYIGFLTKMRGFEDDGFKIPLQKASRLLVSPLDTSRELIEKCLNYCVEIGLLHSDEFGIWSERRKEDLIAQRKSAEIKAKNIEEYNKKRKEKLNSSNGDTDRNPSQLPNQLPSWTPTSTPIRSTEEEVEVKEKEEVEAEVEVYTHTPYNPSDDEVREFASKSGVSEVCVSNFLSTMTNNSWFLDGKRVEHWQSLLLKWKVPQSFQRKGFEAEYDGEYDGVKAKHFNTMKEAL